MIELALKRKTKEFKKPALKELSHEDYLRELANCLKFLKGNTFLVYLQDIMIYKQLIEQRFSILEDGTVSLENLKDPLFKGFIDLLQYNDHEVKITDWKTGGKSIENIERFPKSRFQLDVYMYVAQNIFNPTTMKASYAYVEHDYEKIFTNFNPRETWREILWNIETIENDTRFERNETNLCDYCDYRGICLE